MLTDAVALYTDPANSGVDAAKRARYEAAAQRVATKLEPKTLAFPGKFVEGKGTWADDGTGFVLPTQVLQIGNFDLNWGGQSKQANIIVGSGTVIRNGRLRVSYGHLRLEGTVERPIVLENIKIECDHRGTLTANNVIFLNCTFSKSGNRFMTNGFSSKWELSDCMLVRSNFSSLNMRNYGIKLQRCTFVQCDVPNRPLVDDATKDNTGVFRDGWNTVADCQFYDAQLRPSILWANGKSAYVDCTFAGESTFASSRPLDVEFFTLAEDARFAADATSKTQTKGVGRVNYNVTVIDTAKLKPSPLWRLVPTLSDPTEVPATTNGDMPDDDAGATDPSKGE
jgi:hypothetical protein